MKMTHGADAENANLVLESVMKVGIILHETLSRLAEYQECSQWNRSIVDEKLAIKFWNDPEESLNHIVSQNKTLVYHYDSKTKRQSIQWKHKDSCKVQGHELEQKDDDISFWDRMRLSRLTTFNSILQ